MQIPVFLRRHADDAAETAGKIGRGRKSDRLGNLHHRTSVLHQQLLSSFDFQMVFVLRVSGAHSLVHNPAEVAFADVQSI